MGDKQAVPSQKKNEPTEKNSAGVTFPVVGIGASAGGLDSFVRLLNALPVHPGVAIALIQHLDPHQHSMLTDILSRSSRVPVTEATDGMILQRDHVYVMPPNTIMLVQDGALVLKKRPKKQGRVLPIDGFLESLAADRGELAIGVVLSGTGTDGTLGLAAIRGAGGLTYAEDPSSAEYDGMPTASIEAGVVDAVLDAQGIAGELVRLGQKVEGGESESDEAALDESSLRAILELVRLATGIDLTRYRRSTLLRRISRRMLLEDSDSMSAYLATLESDPAKVQALYRDVLVNMTQFFRDPSVLEAVSREVLPGIVERKHPTMPIRIWVPGCSKGQEAYSILMVVVEFFEQAGRSTEVQMFAADVNEQDVTHARAGVYPEGIERDISAERLARFFIKVPGGYQVTRAIREMCVFATHDITQDPPFSKLDLVSFRNVLIYMERPLQDYVLQVLHYALEPGGFLVLGTSESIEADSSRFEVVDKKNKIFSRKPGPAKLLPRTSSFIDRRATAHPAAPAGADEGFDVFAEADRIVKASYQPAGLVLSPDLCALQFRGNVGPFLTPAEGPPDMKPSRLVPAGLAAAIEGAVREVDKSAVVARRSAAIQRDGVKREVVVEVVPIPQPEGNLHYLALFTERPNIGLTTSRKPNKAGTSVETSEDVGVLVRERDEAREQLGAYISERESASSDLQAVGEKLQTSNEELRTINEEFQTAQEELQSTNEELTTLNDELRNRNAELVQLTDDLSNVIEGVEIPILILTSDLRIRRFTPEAQAIVNIVPGDVGRPLSDLRLRVAVDDLKDRAVAVLVSGVPYVSEVRGDEGRWYSMRIRPYRMSGGATGGVVIAFIDVNDLKRSQRAAQFASQHAEAVVETVRQPLVTLGPDFTIAEANRAFHEMFGTAPEETIGKSFFELRDGGWDMPALRSSIEGILLSGGDEFRHLNIDRSFHGRRRILQVSGRLVLEDVETRAVLLSIDDVTVATRRQALAIALNDIGNTLASTIGFDEIVQRVLKEATEALGAESAALLLEQDGAWVMKGVYALVDDLVGKPLTDEDLPVAIHALRTGEPLLLSDAPKAQRFATSLGIDPEHRTVLLVPILFHDVPIGSLSFHFHRSDLIFTEAEDDFARRLASTMAFALESSELYATQSEIAETLQGALLTVPRKLPGIDFGYLYRSADKAAAVGGDFYDLFELADGRVGILIGDVSGKGVKAATLTALMRNTIRALAYEDNSPARVMKKTNEVVLSATSSSTFVTLLFAILNTSNGSVIYCSAGHTTGLILKEDGKVELLEEQSSLVGAFQTTDFKNGRTSLVGGDQLVVYTDGVTEARRDGVLFGQKRLVSAIQELSGVSVKKLPKEIFQVIKEYAQGKLNDDVAIVAVSRKG